MRNKAGAWFNGENAYIEIPNDVISALDGYTVFAEFMPLSVKGNMIYGAIMQQRYDIVLRFLRNALLEAYFRDDSGNFISVETSIKCEVTKAVVRKDSEKLQLFVDGELRNERTFALNTVYPLPGSYLFVGQAFTDQRFFWGTIMKIVTYPFPLPDANIEKLFKGQLPPHPSLYYDFRLGHALDLSGNGNHGIPHSVEFIGTTPREVE